jgi:Fe2+ or Zn2+ uptake regulation protein
VLIVKSPAELTELFRARGLKVTPQRVGIFQALHGSREHPTAEAVHDQVRVEMPTISLRTVYQTLNDLASMGELGQLELGTGSARFDPTLEPHQHLVCDRCGSVQDVHADLTDVRVPSVELDGFRVATTEVVFRGVCADCQDEAVLADRARGPTH